MKVPFLIATTTMLILTAAPAIGQTPAQNARESQGPRASRRRKKVEPTTTEWLSLRFSGRYTFAPGN